MPAKRTADAGEVANGYALAAKHAKSDIKQRAVDILNAVARGATGAMSTPAATTKAPTTPGVGQSMAVAGLPATLHHQSRPIAAAAAAQPPVSHSSMPKRGGQINIGASNVRSNSKEPANCNRAENAAAWASAMTQIRTSWPEFSDKLEAYISRNEVRAGQKAGAQGMLLSNDRYSGLVASDQDRNGHVQRQTSTAAVAEGWAADLQAQV